MRGTDGDMMMPIMGTLCGCHMADRAVSSQLKIPPRLFVSVSLVLRCELSRTSGETVNNFFDSLSYVSSHSVHALTCSIAR